MFIIRSGQIPVSQFTVSTASLATAFLFTLKSPIYSLLLILSSLSQSTAGTYTATSHLQPSIFAAHHQSLFQLNPAIAASAQLQQFQPQKPTCCFRHRRNMRKGSFYSREDATLLKHDSIEFSIGPFDAPLAKKFKCEVLSPDTSLTGWLARSVDSKATSLVQSSAASPAQAPSASQLEKWAATAFAATPFRRPSKHSGTPVDSTGDLIFHIEDDIAGVSNITYHRRFLASTSLGS